jgi:hypothetical protein
VLNFDSQIPGPTDIPTIRQLEQVEAAGQRIAQQQKAFLIVAANLVGIALLILTRI